MLTSAASVRPATAAWSSRRSNTQRVLGRFLLRGLTMFADR